MRSWHILLLTGLSVQSAIGWAETRSIHPVPTTRQLSGLSAQEATALLAQLEEAQRRLRAGEFQGFELLAGSIASYDKTKVSPRDAFLQVAFMEQIADHGNGNYAYIDGPREAEKVLQQEMSSTLFTIAQDVKIQVEFNPAYVSEYRLIGYENRALAEQDFDNDAVDAGDIGAGHQVTALYEIVPAGSRGWLPDRRYPANQRQADGAANGELAWLRLRYKLPGDDRSLLIEQPVAASMIRTARPASGDMAFIAAVAAYGQKLRGDTNLNGFTFAEARRLAASAVNPRDYWRREFLRLAELADRRTGERRGWR